MIRNLMNTVVLFAITAAMAIETFAQGPSDADIRAAVERGRATPPKKLWDDIMKKQQYRINRAGLVDQIQKKVLLLSDLDQFALEASEAKRQLLDLTSDELKKRLALGVMEVLLEATCPNDPESSRLLKWGPGGGVHVVLKIDGKIVQPLEMTGDASESVAVSAQEQGIMSPRGNMGTYAPLYRSSIYGRSSHSGHTWQRAWFTFPALPPDIKAFVVTAISGEGKQREIEVENPLK
jgi:hypothetical protein